MLRIMSFVDPSTSKELILPVTPATYTWNGPTKLETVSLDQLGEATLHGGTKMGDGSLEDVLLPAQQYPFSYPRPGGPGGIHRGSGGLEDREPSSSGSYRTQGSICR